MNNHTLVQAGDKEGNPISLSGLPAIQFLVDARQPNLNFPADFSTIFFTIFSLLFELLTNMFVLLWVKMKDRALVDTMVTTDCIANLLCMLVILLAFPVRVYRNKVMCAAITFFRGIMVYIKRFHELYNEKPVLILLSRLIPITISLYRYLMVCHHEFCRGVGEKVLSRRLIRWTFVTPIILSFMFTLFSQDVIRDNLVCNGREEAVWYNLNNFLDETFGGKS